MALLARLCTKSFSGLQAIRPVSSQCGSKILLQPKPYKPPSEESHDCKNMRLARPQSPHLTIYKFQLTSMLSITHRFTGIALGAYAAGIGITSLVINKPYLDLVTSVAANHPTFFFLFKAGLIFPFTYHFFNGIRHLVWDSGKSLTIPGVYRSGYMMLLAAICSAIALYFM